MPTARAPEALCDGRLPATDDEPEANFFFAAGTEGGRLAMDLGQVTKVKQVATYSWHAGTRGPQVYKLYVADGTAADFNPKPGGGIAPEKAGWRLVASVDTRPKTGEPGGQYGVAISDPAAGVLAKCRYLLFDVSRTEATDTFGNTFFSEIDISDGKEHAAPPAKKGAVLTAAASGYEIVFDTTDAPELTKWTNSKLRPVCLEWYPKIVEMLPSEGFTAPKRFTVTLRDSDSSIAATSGTRITGSGRWFQQNRRGRGPRRDRPRDGPRRPAIRPGPRRQAQPGLARRGDRRLHPLVHLRAAVEASASQSRPGQLHRQLPGHGGVPELRRREARQGDRQEAQRRNAPGEIHAGSCGRPTPA